MTAYALLLVSIILGVGGQLLLKQGMLKQPNFQLGDIFALTHNFHVIGGFGCYGISVLLYFKVLADIDLSVAYPTVSLGYVLVILVSKMFFKEVVSLTRWTAIMIICIGVALVGFGTV